MRTLIFIKKLFIFNYYSQQHTYTNRLLCLDQSKQRSGLEIVDQELRGVCQTFHLISKHFVHTFKRTIFIKSCFSVYTSKICQAGFCLHEVGVPQETLRYLGFFHFIKKFKKHCTKVIMNLNSCN